MVLILISDCRGSRLRIGYLFIYLSVNYKMAKVAARAPLPSSSNHFDKLGSGSVSKVTTAVKRKTPSELRVSFDIQHLLIASDILFSRSIF